MHDCTESNIPTCTEYKDMQHCVATETTIQLFMNSMGKMIFRIKSFGIIHDWYKSQLPFKVGNTGCLGHNNKWRVNDDDELFMMTHVTR